MFCLKVDVPQEICDIDDELKAVYHSKDSVCIWIFESTEKRNLFIKNTIGMDKSEREKYYTESFRPSKET